MRKAKLMRKINFEGDAVTNIKQESLQSVANLLQEQLKLEGNTRILNLQIHMKTWKTVLKI